MAEQTKLTEFVHALPALPVPQMRPIINYPLPSVKVPIEFPPLRQMQQDAVSAFMASPTKHASIILPVASGKTLVALRIWALLGEPKMLIVVPQIVLITNPWLQEMQKVGIEPNSVGQFYSEEKMLRFPITVTLYQTLILKPQIISRFQFVVFDEEQFLGSEQFGKLLQHVNPLPFVLGMTGTLQEAARKNPALTSALPVVFERTIAEARKASILAPAEIIPIYISLTPNEYATYAELTETYRRIVAFANSVHDPMRRQIELRKAFIVNQKRLTLLSNAQEKMKEVQNLIKQEPASPTLLFSQSVPGIEALKRALIYSNVPAETITAKLHDRTKRQRIISNFGKKYFVLMSVGTLQVGFNVPEASREIIMGSGATLTQVEQRLGRVLRRDPNNPGKVAKVYVMIARGTVDEDVLRTVNQAYNRLRSEVLRK